MSRTRKCAIYAPWLIAAAVSAAELVIPITVDESVSSLEVQLCAQGPGGQECDTDTQQLSGTLLVAVDCTPVLEQVALRDFRVRAVTDYSFLLDYGFLGEIRGSVTNLEVYHAAPGPQQPFAPLTLGAARFFNVPNLLRGLTVYRASGLACVVLQNNEIPCADTINLGNRPTNILGELPAQVEVINNQLRFSGSFRFSVPISEDDSSLGMISGNAVIVAAGAIAPCLRIEHGPFNHVVRWFGAFTGFELRRSRSLMPPVTWEPVLIAPSNNGALWSVPLGNEQATFFYRLERN